MNKINKIDDFSLPGSEDAKRAAAKNVAERAEREKNVAEVKKIIHEIELMQESYLDNGGKEEDNVMKDFNDLIEELITGTKSPIEAKEKAPKIWILKKK